MIYNVITFKNGEKQKCDDKYTEEEIRKACALKGLEVEKIERLGLVNSEPTESKQVYFEVRLSYDDTHNLFVTEKELPFVYFAMENNTLLYLGGGAIRGQNIIDVMPDYNSWMGWNRGYKPSPEDYAELQRSDVTALYRDIMADTKLIARKANGDQKELVKLINEGGLTRLN